MKPSELISGDCLYSAKYSIAALPSTYVEHVDFGVAAVPAAEVYHLHARLLEDGSTGVPKSVLEHVQGLRAAADEELERMLSDVGRKLYAFQRGGVSFLRSASRCLLGDEMGLGKTVQALMALPRKAKGMVIAPRSLLLNWQAEGQAWRPDLTWSVVDRSGLRLFEDGEMLITTPDAVRSHHAKWAIPHKLLPIDRSFIVLDEAHLYKNSESKRSEAMSALVTHFSHRWLLTGTPLTRDPLDLWGVLSVAGMAKQMFGSWEDFVSTFGGVEIRKADFDGNDVSRGWKWAREPVRKDYLARAFQGRSLRRLRREVAPQIPAKTYTVIRCPDTVELTAADRRAVTLGLMDDGSLDETLGAPVALVRRKLAESKVPTMLGHCERFRAEGQPLVIASANRGPIERLAEEYSCPVIHGDISIEERQRAVEVFQDGGASLIGIQVQAGGVGITLTRACHLLFVQRDWSLECTH